MISHAPDSSMRPQHRPHTRVRLVALSTLSIVLTFGCGNEASNGSGGTNGAGASSGTGATGGNGVAPFRGAVLCSLAQTPTGFPGFIRLVSEAELEAAEQTGEVVDSVEGAIEFAGGVSCAVRDHSVFAFDWENPTVTRFDEVEGMLVEGQSVSFANLGVTSLNSSGDERQVVFASDTKAFFLDPIGRQVVIWNPNEMETIGSIPLTLSDSPEGLNLGAVLQIVRMDERLLVWGGWSNADGTNVARINFWFIDTETDAVVATDVTQECGGFGRPNIAANGDVYIGSEAFSAMQHALDLPGSFAPCAIRIRAGTTEVDTSYAADLRRLTGGLPTSGPYVTFNDQGFLAAYDTSRMPIDPRLTSVEHVLLENWDWYEWELGSEQPATRVDSIPTGIGQVDTRTFDGKPFLFRPNADFTTSELLDLTQRPVERTYAFSGITWVLARLGTQPDARMAQRIEPRGGLSVLSF